MTTVIPNHFSILTGKLFDYYSAKKPMKSRAQIKSHPLHPILVVFPIAFFTGTLLFHALGMYLNKAEFLYTAYLLNIAAVAGAVAAAIPGIIDFIYTVPPKSSAKKRAAQHGLTNTTVLIIFTALLFYRNNQEANQTIILIAEIVGVMLMMIAGWLGGTLVYRNQIGVDQRYGNAGKWNEQYFEQDNGLIQAATADELKINAMKLLHLRKRRIVLARTENGYVAFDDRCPHKGGSLAGGSMMCGVVQCPWHGSQFKLDGGVVVAGPAEEGIATYEVINKDGKIFIRL